MGYSKKGKRSTGKKKKQDKEEAKSDEQVEGKEESETFSKEGEQREIDEFSDEENVESHEENEQGIEQDQQSNKQFDEQSKKISQQNESQNNIGTKQEKIETNHQNNKESIQKYESKSIQSMNENQNNKESGQKHESKYLQKTNENQNNQEKQTIDSFVQQKKQEDDKHILQSDNQNETQIKHKEPGEINVIKVFDQNDGTIVRQFTEDVKTKIPSQELSEPSKTSQTVSESDVFDRLIDHFRGERSRYFRGVFFYGCCRSAYNFFSHLPIQRLFFSQFENVLDNVLFFAGVVPSEQSKDHTSIEEFNNLLTNYFDQIDHTVDATKDNSLDQLKVLKGMIIKNPIFQTTYHTITAISSRVLFLKHN